MFLNHPKIGTIKVPKTRPSFKSKRWHVMQQFLWALSNFEDISCAMVSCKVCKKSLLNPHSILLHIGNCCESKTVLKT